ncbi:outer membrane lipoprotein carrier protein LolA [Pseudomonas fluvialis]|jgi:outer membrane lipoprotein carrier protein|uniref:Outer-membrane lipoprotein carrier protein n=1 Tax=Pseudomonas fluvialis TaxID=1793966 RepID=A0ABQ2AKC5_9PSED|nr:outer membrane lipoprotein chaperone LolA [Pseudomonas fluvialis]MBP7823699.1 outer membrane lipoprotein chaperone LolA [Pseudomonas sp.]OXM39825.1 outer membrane lipoprotein carrier protein LolA [Pseudomonas fluvialis]GGH91549.1 outer-membrane lipoprotein carrier protein [Pseudomonas fluvialis]
MRLILTAVVALTWLFAGQAYADAASARLSDLLGKAETLSGRFSQLTLDASGTHLQEATGQMELKRPGLFRWHTDAPLEQLLVSNGQQVWLYDPDLEQVTIQQLDQRLTHTPALLLSGDVSKIGENFTIEFKEAGDVVDFILRPKARDTLFDTLRLSFRGGLINDMQLIDSVGQRTNILFMGVQLNQPLAAERFTFEIPAGVDVIQQ